MGKDEKKARQEKALAEQHKALCPNCGHCPTCGRANQQFVPVPYYPYWYWQQPTNGPWWRYSVTSGGNSMDVPRYGQTEPSNSILHGAGSLGLPADRDSQWPAFETTAGFGSGQS